MRFTAAVLLLLALALVPAAFAPEKPRPEAPAAAAGAQAVVPESHDVFEMRVLVLTTASTEGLDVRLGNVLGTDAGGRFFTVAADDPEGLVRNLGNLGQVEVADRANITGLPARYRSTHEVLTPQIELRGNGEKFIRANYRPTGTSLSLDEGPEGRIHAKVEASLVLGHRPDGIPLFGSAMWDTPLDLAPGRTAVLRSQIRLSVAEQGTDATDDTARPVARQILVLLTRSNLP
jgi:hypothetical protein